MSLSYRTSCRKRAYVYLLFVIVAFLEANGYSLDVTAEATALSDTSGGDASESIATSANVELSFVGAPNRRITIHGLSYLLEIPERANKTVIAMNMTLCVPMVPADIKVFKMHFMRNLNAQTVMPSELGVALSGVSEADAREFESNLRGLVKNIPIFVTSVQHKALPGENRNRCMIHSHGEVITFFDADDTMHSRRIETLDYVFRELHPKMVIHEYRDSRVAGLSDFGNKFACLGASTLEYKGASSFGTSNVKMAQGWATVSREVFAHVQYNESRLEGEDVQFLSDTMEAFGSGTNGNTVLLLRLPLGLYVPRKLSNEPALSPWERAMTGAVHLTKTVDEARAKFHAASDERARHSDKAADLRGAARRSDALALRHGAERRRPPGMQEGWLAGRRADARPSVREQLRAMSGAIPSH